MRVGFIGLGIMGSRMSRRLLAAGHDVSVFNRTQEKAAQLVQEGAVLCATPGEVAAQSEVLFTVLSAPRVVEEMALQEQGLLDQLPEGAIWIDCTTVDPAFSETMGRECVKRGVRYLEAPVSGTRSEADNGTLVFSVGGDEADLMAARPVMESLGSAIDYLGGHGKAASLKLVLNHLMASSITAFAEAALLGEAVGIERDRMLRRMTDSAATAPFIKDIIDRFSSGEDKTDFSLALMEKDMNLILETAEEVSLNVEVAKSVQSICRDAVLAGYSDRDYSSIYEFLRSRSVNRFQQSSPSMIVSDDTEGSAE